MKQQTYIRKSGDQVGLAAAQKFNTWYTPEYFIHLREEAGLLDTAEQGNRFS